MVKWVQCNSFASFVVLYRRSKKYDQSKWLVCILLYAEKSAAAVWRPVFQWVLHLQASSLWLSATPPVAPELHGTAALPPRCLPADGSYQCTQEWLSFVMKWVSNSFNKEKNPLNPLQNTPEIIQSHCSNQSPNETDMILNRKQGKVKIK